MAQRIGTVRLYSQHDQIFLVLCGHQHGQNLRIDPNMNGLPVYQVLADYQDRGQAGIDAGQVTGGFAGAPVGIGDGWSRQMEFDLAAQPARVKVRTYSSYYAQYSDDVAEYPQWYRDHEQPQMTDAQFYAADDYVLVLDDFSQRFAAAKLP